LLPASHSPVRRPPCSTPFPYTTLFRSRSAPARPAGGRLGAGRARQQPPGRGSRRPWRDDAGNLVPPGEPVPVPAGGLPAAGGLRSEEHTSELQSRFDLVCRLLLEKKNN